MAAWLLPRLVLDGVSSDGAEGHVVRSRACSAVLVERIGSGLRDVALLVPSKFGAHSHRSSKCFTKKVQNKVHIFFFALQLCSAFSVASPVRHSLGCSVCVHSSLFKSEKKKTFALRGFLWVSRVSLTSHTKRPRGSIFQWLSLACPGPRCSEGTIHHAAQRHDSLFTRAAFGSTFDRWSAG